MLFNNEPLQSRGLFLIKQLSRFKNIIGPTYRNGPAGIFYKCSLLLNCNTPCS